MKNYYLFFALFTINLISAQDLRLFDNTWYLTKTVENGVENAIGVPNLTLTFNLYNNYLQTYGGCNELSGSLTFDNNLTNFTLLSRIITLRVCSDVPFEGYYFSIFGNFGTATNFSYSISENGIVKTLTLTNLSSNTQAIYSNQNLSTIEVKPLYFSIYSEPSSNRFIIELNNQNAENTKVELFDSLGRLFKSNVYNSAKITIGTEDLSKGVYILKITKASEVGIKKFIKS